MNKRFLTNTKINALFQVNQFIKDHFPKIASTFGPAIDGMALIDRMAMKRNGSRFRVERRLLKRKHTNTALKTCKANIRVVKINRLAKFVIYCKNIIKKNRNLEKKNAF